MPPQLFTIGHSTHPLERLLELLRMHGIKVLADIRRFPGSRKFPQFNRENLDVSVHEARIKYRWFEELGGRRPKKGEGPSKNLGLRNESFRNYADYMLTELFHEQIELLLEVARQQPTAMMCSESVFWRCHRRLVSDFLLVNGIDVQHIMPSGELRPHTLTEGAKVESGELTYPAPVATQTKFLFE